MILTVSSWKMFQSGNLTYTVPWIHRTAIRPIQDFNSVEEGQEHYQNVLTSASSTNTFTLNPNGWMKLFGITEQKDIDDVNRRIVARVREVEEELSKTRGREGKTVLGAQKLKTQPINLHYTPKKFSPRMWCIRSDIAFRKTFIEFIKALISEAKEVTSRWRMGDFSLPFPLGLFPPRLPRLANIRPGTVFAA